MKYRIIGDTGVSVSVLGCGGFRLPTVGGDDGTVDRTAAGAAFAYAFEHGVNFFDSSFVYHGGDSERFIGEFQRAHGIRDRMVLCTKLPSWLVKDRRDPERILGEQLKRLQTDHVDFYLIHMLTAERWAAMKALGIVDFFRRATADGRIRHVGFSSHDVQTLALLKDYPGHKLVLKQYNYLDRNLQGADDVIAQAGAGGYGVGAMEPLRGGLLGDKMPASWKSALRDVRIEATEAAKGLLWVLTNPGIAVTLTGMGRLEHAVENVATANMLEDLEGNADFRKQYERVTAGLRDRQIVRCTGCDYCAPHCPERIPIAYNLELLNFLAAELGVRTRTELLRVNAATVPNLGEHFSVVRNSMDLAPNERASACTSCRRCEEHCPQQIRIADELATFAYVTRQDQLPLDQSRPLMKAADAVGRALGPIWQRRPKGLGTAVRWATDKLRR
jgi:uncharacterized protein